MRTHRTLYTFVPFILILLLMSAAVSMADESAAGSSAAADRGAALIQAAQQQDLAKVRELLKAGVDVNSTSRYGATALFFAAGKGNLAMVELLLEKGAAVDVTDTFYQATPLGWVLSEVGDEPSDHRQVALLILAKAPEDASGALSAAARLGDQEMAQAAIATEKVDVDSIRAAQLLAEEEHPELATWLATKLPSAEDVAEDASEVAPLTSEERKPYLGTFRNEERELLATVSAEGDAMSLVIGDPPALTLHRVGDGAFIAKQNPELVFQFSGRGGLIESFVLQRGDFELAFARHVVDTSATEEPAELAALPEVERQPARPWPAFRGSNADGNGDGQGIPFEWSGETQNNIRWKTEIPGIGLSSPVIWGDTVFLTTAISSAADNTFRTGLYGDVDSVDDTSEHIWRLYALNRTDGKVLWQRQASRRAPKVKRHLKSSHANPTPVTDGRYVVAHFASEGIFCYDMDGNLKWKKDIGTLNSGWFYDVSYEWGFASSPILHEGRLILQTDIQQGSFIAALDLETGNELWRTERDEIPTWGTPSVLPAAEDDGVDEIVTNGTVVRGYNAATGEELWTLAPNSEVTVGTPVIGEGMAFVTGGYPPARPIYAIKPGGRGDLSLADDATSSQHIAWTVNPGGTYIPSPVFYRGILYMLNNNGRLAAYDAKTGERIYRQRVDSGTSFSASPIAADGRLLITSEEGVTYIVRAGEVYEELGRNELGEVVMTSAAVSDGVLVLRGIDHVFGIGAGE